LELTLAARRPQLPALDPPPSPRPTSLEALAEQVADVVAALKLREVLGLGVGTGAYVLIKAAAAAPKVFCGLALLSPAVTRAGWWEWAASAAAATSLSWRGWTPAARDHFAQRLLSLASLQLYGGDSDLVRALRRDVGDVPAPAAAAGLRAAAARADATADVGRLRCRLLLVYGAEGIYAGDALALGAAADKGRFALVEVPGAGVLVGEERAGELVSPLQLFLTNLQLDGYGLGASLQVGE
jgi:pimeloyl-ACP methyl ester carboxylesterase